MNISKVTDFQSLIINNISLKTLLDEFLPNLNAKVDNIEKARSIFSNALKITRYVDNQENIKTVWLDLLRQGSFTLSLKNHEPIKYHFNTIIALSESFKTEFEIELVKVDPENSDLLAIAKAISRIFLESFGQVPEIEFFHQILSSKETFCVVAKEKENIIACSYGTHINVEGVELFHLNLVGRRIEYPSLRMIENLRNQLTVLKDHYPFLQYLTLSVSVENSHMISVYEQEGFQKCGYDEKGTMGFPIYFYFKKIDPNLDIPIPTYEAFQAAMKIKREKQRMEFLKSSSSC